MVLTTMIARVGDGLPLAASVSDDEAGILEYQNQAKLLFRKLNFNSPERCTIESGPCLFHYIIDNNICYLVLCDRSFPKRVAFSYLEDLRNEFFSQYGEKVQTVMRPYHFIEFDNYIQKAKKSYTDARARRNLSHLNTELQDVQRIMIRNIDDVLQRGSALSELDNKASNLSILSQKYKKDTHYLNLKSTYAKVAAAGVIVFVFILYFWIL